jgi:hypothetical protein
MTLAELAALVVEQLTRGTDEITVGVEETAVEAVLREALTVYSLETFMHGDSQLLMKEFGFTMVSGVADLSDPTLHIKTISEVRHPASTKPLQPLASRADVDHLPSELYNYYAISEKLLYGYGGDKQPLIDTSVGALKVIAWRIPKEDLTDFPDNIGAKGELAAICGRLIKERGV